MNFFDQFPEFIDSDVRKDRGTTTVTSESLSKRCAVLLPKWSVQGKKILDLGHCAGAMGHWSLINGAEHYTGVDIQKDFCDTSVKLLSNHWSSDKFTIVQMDVVKFMKQQVELGESYDLILASGIIHGYINTVEFIELMTKLSKKYIVVENVRGDEDEKVPAITFKMFNMVSNLQGYPYQGWSAVVGFNALRTIMSEFGFKMHAEMKPEKITGTHDAYNDDIKLDQDKVYGRPSRYMVRYEKTQFFAKNSLEHKIINDVQKYQKAYLNINKLTINKAPVWKFDKSVAQRFQQEAETNIPDYERVIDMCIEIAKQRCDVESHIVDVGSALGHTIEKFTNAGFMNVSGVEASKDMIDNSAFASCVTLSETFPIHWNTNFVMANWTLHFVNERKQYIQDVYTSLSLNGTFILTDKTIQSDTIKKLYYDFKRANGISDEYIYEKEEKLKGYMNLLPVEWYIETLQEVGFNNVQIINSKYGFVTFYAEK